MGMTQARPFPGVCSILNTKPAREERLGRVYWFSKAAVTNYHDLGNKTTENYLFTVVEAKNLKSNWATLPYLALG